MPSASNSNRRGTRLHVLHRHRLLLQRANNALAFNNAGIRRVSGPETMPAATSSHQFMPITASSHQPMPVAGPSTFPGSMYGPTQPNGNFGRDPLYATPASFEMQLDDDSEYGGGSREMSVVTESEHSSGSSTVVPPEAPYHPQAPPNAYHLTAVDLDNLRNAVHFLQHATILVCDVMNAMHAQNPHCHRFPA
ncbi:hypothetical protein EST38_g10094 [Candolleomyces aberdarensis]|uniref:Uncharacterized protein n=1 Tax=Candolleomyces aberdarensis TaxID=2316362 RepID=A0A4Q2DB39_9AGAR|nr:hypothetical protein EST38_g10094 [Candolleomyces aberdarensis]